MLTMAYASLGSPAEERFITLSTTGSDMTTRTLYPGSTSSVGEGQTLNWKVLVENHMGETEYVAIRVKLLNATQFGPDDERHLPSPSNFIYEERMVIANNASLITPLSITLEDTEVVDGDSMIRSVVINGKDLNVPGVPNQDSSEFRFVIELWRFDVKFENFVYIWPSGSESESAWNQIRIQIK
jgi:hypothetical protein